MSPLKRGYDLSQLTRGLDPALFHFGDYMRLMRVHLSHCRRYHAGRAPDPAPTLFRRIADARTLKLSAEELFADGAKAAGPDGMHIEDWSEPEQWELCRVLASDLRDGRYLHGPVRKVFVPKSNGGRRQLTVQNGEDRIVCRAVSRVLTPVLDPNFSPLSVGGRPGYGRVDALATASKLFEREGRAYWVVADVAAAFDAIPHGRLISACAARLPADVVELLKLATPPSRGRRGIYQGAPHSPLLANYFFDHYVDQPLRRSFPSWPMIRFVDDVLVPCRSRDEAETVRGELQRAFRSAGTPLKPDDGDSICDLKAGDVCDWLGYRVSFNDGSVRVDIADEAWRILDEGLRDRRAVGTRLEAVASSVKSWLSECGPAYRRDDRQATIDRVLLILHGLNYQGAVSAAELLDCWQAAFSRWTLRRGEAAWRLDQMGFPRWADPEPE